MSNMEEKVKNLFSFIMLISALLSTVTKQNHTNSKCLTKQCGAVTTENSLKTFYCLLAVGGTKSIKKNKK